MQVNLVNPFKGIVMEVFMKIFKIQEIRFLFVGGLNTIVGYGIYAILIFLNINYLLSNTISTILGVLHSYLWNRFFTFKSKEKASKESLMGYRFLVLFEWHYHLLLTMDCRSTGEYLMLKLCHLLTKPLTI